MGTPALLMHSANGLDSRRLPGFEACNAGTNLQLDIACLTQAWERWQAEAKEERLSC